MTNEKKTQVLGGSKIALATERNKVVKFSTAKVFVLRIRRHQD